MTTVCRISALTEIAKLDVPQHVQAALFDIVDEGDEAYTASRVGDHQQNLRPPELDMILPHIQHEQILPYLEVTRKRKVTFKYTLTGHFILYSVS